MIHRDSGIRDENEHLFRNFPLVSNRNIYSNNDNLSIPTGLEHHPHRFCKIENQIRSSRKLIRVIVGVNTYHPTDGHWLRPVSSTALWGTILCKTIRVTGDL